MERCISGLPLAALACGGGAARPRYPPPPRCRSRPHAPQRHDSRRGDRYPSPGSRPDRVLARDARPRRAARILSRLAPEARVGVLWHATRADRMSEGIKVAATTTAPARVGSDLNPSVTG